MAADDDFLALALPFDSEHPEFARGFEAGVIYVMAKTIPEPFHYAARSTNVAMLHRIAEVTKRELAIKHVEDDRVELHFDAVRRRANA